MRLKTTQFGELELEEENIVNFPEGLIGFEEYKKFIIISDKELDPLLWLLSIEDPEIEFPILNPKLFFASYNPVGISESENVVLFSIVTLKKDMTEITTNLKGPLVVDFKKREGKQVILDSDQFHANHKIFDFIKV
jgi:flagellar assembly factor FliW